MSRMRRIIKNGALVALLVGSLAAAYWAGYKAGLDAEGPQHRHIVVTRGSGNPKSSGSSYQYFDISKASDAERFREEQRRLDAIGADYYIDEPYVETRIMPGLNLSRVNSRR